MTSVRPTSWILCDESSSSSAWSAPAIAIQKCPRCSAMKRPHHVCEECGFYAGEQRIEAAEA